MDRSGKSAPPKRSDGAIANTRRYVEAKSSEARPYLKMAFANPYNLSLFGGALVAAAATAMPVIALAAVGLEALWLLHAPDSKSLRRLVWDPAFDRMKEEEAERARQERLRNLPLEDQQRVQELVSRKIQIQQLAQQNPSFTGELLRQETTKTDRLVDSFIDMAVTCSRYEQYLRGVDIDDIERDRRTWESRLKNADGAAAQADIAKKNLAIILKRLEKIREIRTYLSVARGQLELIENSFQLIADQIVTMNSPGELTSQLDELLDGVESIRETAIDTERLLGVME